MISYVALNDAARSAPGQLTIAEVHLLANILQPETSKRETDKTASSSNPLPLENDGNNGRSNAAVYAVFGNPIRHSLSPLLHNTAFRRLGINGVYVPFCVQDIAVAVSAIRELGMKGVSVTLPFKSAVIPFLDRMDESALAIGAVNTIVNNNGELIGYNTDWSGAMAALTSLVNIAEKRIAILGAGGTARAICFGVKKYGAIPLIINRSAPRGEALAHEWGISFYTSKEWRQVEADILINTTPMGMNPLAAELPLPTEALSRFSVVMDIIYNPLETMLLREAKKAGAQTISGTEMFVQQGAQQIQLWTGKTVPLALLRSTVLAALTATEITAGTVNPKKERR
ncbi:MAG: shikimate dehydrogenase [Deltaproteobacteria bacterium]|nr:shikimate dehydrogenase [Deltaproteobacteria bacterium]